MTTREITIKLPRLVGAILKGAGKTIKDVETFDPDCWEWRRAKSSEGYPNIRLSKSEKREIREHWPGDVPSFINGHKVSATVFSPWLRPWGRDAIACHSCDNPGCVNPHHLYAGSTFLNVIDEQIKKGPGAWRRSVPPARLLVALETVKAGAASSTSVSKELGMPPSAMCKIVKDGAIPKPLPAWVGLPPFDRFARVGQTIVVSA